MKMKRFGAALLAGAMMMTGLAGCGSSGSSDNGSAASTSKNKVSLWATGSDNVREVYEALIEDFNKNSEYAGK